MLQSHTFGPPLFLLLAALLAGGGCHMAANGKNVEGVSLLEQGNYQAAMERFQDALNTDPRNADAIYNLGSVYYYAGMQQGNQEMLRTAENHYLRCLELEPDHVEAHRSLAVLLAKTNRAEQAFQSLQAWSQRRPELTDPKIELARLYQEYGDKDMARRQLQEAITGDIRDKRAWNALAALYEQSGDANQALASYNRSLQLDPSQTQVATRVAALQRGVAPGPVPSQPGNRWVQTPTIPLR
jgi:tetratricopeptide (TPR) repeat protein